MSGGERNRDNEPTKYENACSDLARKNVKGTGVQRRRTSSATGRIVVKEERCGGGAAERDGDAGGARENGAQPKSAGGARENGAQPKLMAADGEYKGTGRVRRGTQVT